MCCTRLTGLKSGVMFCLSLIEVYWIAVAKKKIFADLGKRMAVFLWGNGKHCKGKPRPKIILRQTGNQSQEIEKSFGAEWKINLSQTICLFHYVGIQSVIRKCFSFRLSFYFLIAFSVCPSRRVDVPTTVLAIQDLPVASRDTGIADVFAARKMEPVTEGVGMYA